MLRQLRLQMKQLILSEPGRVRLFDRKLNKDGEKLGGSFAGLIIDNQKTHYSACTQCCEVYYKSSQPLKHEFYVKSDFLKDKPIEKVEI